MEEIWLAFCNWISSFLNKTTETTEEETTDNQGAQMLTLEQLLTINEGKYSDKCEYYLTAINTVLAKYEINTPLRICHFLAQVLHESGHLYYSIENLNYSATALRAVFGKYFTTDAIAEEYARQPEKIANRVYANRMDNGDEASGDGWKYRGRGLIQLTGRYNYTTCASYLGLDLVNDPDLLIATAEASVGAACWYWNTNSLNTYADADDVLTITKRINGGTNGLEDRTRILNLAKGILLA